MAIKNIELNVTTRSTGKHDSRALRRNAQVPAVVYGYKVKGAHIAAGEKEIRLFSSMAYENAIFTLKSSDKTVNDVKVLIKEVSVHPVTRRPVHVDFLAIDLNKPVRVFVELRFEGKAAGLSDGGMLQSLIREVEVEALPTAIPEFLSVDVSPLGIGDTLHVSDIKLPAGVKAVSKAELAIVSVTVVKEEVIAAPVAAATPAEGAAGTPAAGAAAAPAAGAKKDAAPAKTDKK